MGSGTPHGMESRILHRRLAAMLVGIAVAVCVVVATFALLPSQKAGAEGKDFGYVYSGAKSSSVDFVRSQLGDDGLLMLGSSEFSTPARLVPQIPAEVFGKNNFGLRPMLVGEAFDQSLWHAIALGALADGGLPQNKVVLIVSLGQYTDGGLDAATFGTRFSYSLYQAFCANPDIPDELRQKVRARLAEQGVDDVTLRAGDPADFVGAIDGAVLGAMDDLKIRSDLMGVRAKGIPVAGGEAAQPDWDALRATALADAQRMSTTNDWGLEDAFYTEQLAPALDSLAGARADETYTDTPEYDDLDLFLSVCDACGVTPLVVIEPACGPYYDHIGITQETRDTCYQHIRDVVAAHGSACVADFTDREYEPYFVFDIVHFGWTGWVEAEKAIYEFAKGV